MYFHKQSCVYFLKSPIVKILIYRMNLMNAYHFNGL